MCSEMVAGRYFLAFDHQPAFGQWVGGGPAALLEGIETGELIFDAVEVAAMDVPVSQIGVLVDHRCGERVLERARTLGVTLGISAGAFDAAADRSLESDALSEEVLAAEPDVVKVLVRHSDDLSGPAVERLRALSELLAAEGRQFLLHLVVPPTEARLRRVAGDLRSFEEGLRPALVCKAIRRLQDAGVEPTTWKVEGIDRRAAAEAVAAAARRGGRDRVDCVLLGSGAAVDRVNRWLRVAAQVDGFVGFAIGRSIWQRFIERYLVGEIDRGAAVAGIAAVYSRFIDVFADPRNVGVA